MTVTEEFVKPERLAAVAIERILSAEVAIKAFWYEVLGSRDEYARHLISLFTGQPIVVLVVRDVYFDNPNALRDEFVRLIAQNRDSVEQQLSAVDGPQGHYGFVLLTRSAPRFPQVSSPAVLPGWFPVYGGRTISISLENVTWTADAPLDSEEFAVPEVCSRLFDLDGVLLQRLTSVHGRSRTAVDSLWSRLSPSGAGSFAEFVLTARETRAAVRGATSFRPEGKDGSTVVARLWRTMQRTAPESVGKTAEALAVALDLPQAVDKGWYQSILSVLARPANPVPTMRRAFASNLLRTVATSAQLITVKAHADQYGDFPVVLLRSVSFDVRRALADCEAILADLDE